MPKPLKQGFPAMDTGVGIFCRLHTTKAFSGHLTAFIRDTEKGASLVAYSSSFKIPKWSNASLIATNLSSFSLGCSYFPEACFPLYSVIANPRRFFACEMLRLLTHNPLSALIHARSSLKLAFFVIRCSSVSYADISTVIPTPFSPTYRTL